MIACLFGPPLLIYAYARYRYKGSHLLYLKWRFSHTYPAISFRYLNKQEYEALWQRVKNGGAIRIGPSAGSKPLAISSTTGDEKDKKGDKAFDGMEDGEYTGAYSNGKPNGLGTARYPNGTVYTGQWAEGKREGHGFEENLAMGTVYEGGWRNDLKNGHGGYRLKKTGAVYDGEFYDDKKEGRGTCRFADGDVYTGQWKNDMQEGVGTYLYADGRAEVGAYAAHRDIGAGVRWSADRTQAWRMQEGHVAIVGGEISIAEARVLSARIGLPVPLSSPAALMAPKDPFPASSEIAKV